MRIDDASREVKDRVLQGQQPHQTVSACELHIPWFYVSTEEGTEQTPPDFHQFLAGCERGCLEAAATDSAWVETESTDPCDACRTGDAIQPNHPRVGELLRGVLSDSHAPCLSAIDRALERWARRKYKALS